jgi:hypothetical protein
MYIKLEIVLKLDTVYTHPILQSQTYVYFSIALLTLVT